MKKSYHYVIMNMKNKALEVIEIVQWDAEERNKIDAFLARVRALAPTGSVQFQRSEKNTDFDRKYNLTHKEKIQIIRSLTADDCIKIDKNTNPRYKDADVFIFLKSILLECYGEENDVPLYLKGYIIIDDSMSMEMVIVISFHEEGVYE